MLLPYHCLRKRIGFRRKGPGILEEQLTEPQGQEYFNSTYQSGVLGEQRISPISGERQFVDGYFKGTILCQALPQKNKRLLKTTQNKCIFEEHQKL